MRSVGCRGSWPVGGGLEQSQYKLRRSKGLWSTGGGDAKGNSNIFENDLIEITVLTVRTNLSSGLYAELSFEQVGFGKPDVGTICNQPFGR